MSIKEEYVTCHKDRIITPENIMNIFTEDLPKYRRTEGLICIDKGLPGAFYSKDETLYSMHKGIEVVKYDKFCKDEKGSKIILSAFYDEKDENIWFIRKNGYNVGIRDESAGVRVSPLCIDTYYPYTDIFEFNGMTVERNMGMCMNGYYLKEINIFTIGEELCRESFKYDESGNLKERDLYRESELVETDILRYDYYPTRLIDMSHKFYKNGKLVHEKSTYSYVLERNNYEAFKKLIKNKETADNRIKALIENGG